jgi:hypothetical protein
MTEAPRPFVQLVGHSSATVCDLAVSGDAAATVLLGFSVLHGNVWSGGAVAVQRGAQRTFAAAPQSSSGVGGAGIAAVAFHGDKLVAAGDSGDLWIASAAPADAEPLVAKVVKRAHFDIVTCLASDAARPLLSASFDRTVRVWGDLELALAGVTTLTGHSDAVLGVAHAHGDDQLVLSCARDGLAGLWDVRTARCVRVFSLRRRSALTTIAATTDAGFVVGAMDGSVAHFDLRAGGPSDATATWKTSNTVNRVRVLQDRSIVFVDDDGQAKTIPHAAGEPILVARTSMPLRSLAVDHVNNALLVGQLGCGQVNAFALRSS